MRCGLLTSLLVSLLSVLFACTTQRPPSLVDRGVNAKNAASPNNRKTMERYEKQKTNILGIVKKQLDSKSIDLNEYTVGDYSVLQYGGLIWMFLLSPKDGVSTGTGRLQVTVYGDEVVVTPAIDR